MSDNLLIQALLITLVAFIGYMHCYWGSTMNNRPIIVAPLVGLVLGDMTTGIMVGATLELIFLGAVPIGASNPPDITSGAIIGTSFVILTGQEVGAAVALAVPVATLVLLFDNLQMMFILTWATHMADSYAKKGDYKKVEWVARFAGIGNKLILSIVVGVAFYLGVPVIKDVLSVIPQFIIDGMYINGTYYHPTFLYESVANVIGCGGRNSASCRVCHAGKDDCYKRIVSLLVSWISVSCIYGNACIRCSTGRLGDCRSYILS